MKYQLEEFDAIDEDSLQGLAQAGIVDTDQLLDRASFPRQRETLAEELGMPIESILRWAGLADLVRVKGVGPKLAQLLVRASVQSVQDLSSSEPQALRKQLKAANSEYRTLARSPSERQVAECVEEARELRSRLVPDIPAQVDFRREAQQRDQEEAQVVRRARWIWIPSVGAPLILALVIVIVLEYSQLSYWPAGSQQLESMMQKAERIWFLFNISPVISLLVLVSVSAVLAIQLWKGLNHLLMHHLRFRLFDHPAYQSCYLYMNQSIPVRHLMIAGMLAAIAYVIIAVGVVLLKALDVDLLVVAIAILPPMLALTILYPDVRGTWQVYRQKIDFGPAALQRYLAYRLLYVIATLGWLLVLLRVLLPGAILGHRFVFERFVNPLVRDKIGAISGEVAELDLQKTDDAMTRAFFLDKFNPSKMELRFQRALVLPENGESLAEGLFSKIGSAVIWMLILVTVAYFVVPFIVLGRIKQALLFLIILPVSEGVEYLLTNYVPGLFFLPRGSVLALLLSGALLLSNTILFDWFYQERTEKYKQCVACGQELDSEARFCSRCGNPQPAMSVSEAKVR